MVTIRDLERLYECANGTKTINLAVKRHTNKFLVRFMFQLTKDEYYNILRFQTETLELKQGVAMLSSVLHSEIPIKMSIQTINAFDITSR